MTMGGLIGPNILVGRAMGPADADREPPHQTAKFRMSLSRRSMLMQLPSEGQNDNEYVEFGKLDASFPF